MRYEAIPARQGDVAAFIFEEVTRFIEEGDLSLGEGTVLAGRWGHRRSLDVDLFCEPRAYSKLTPATRGKIEQAIHQIPGCATARTRCEDIETYSEIEGIEATILPRPVAIEPERPTMLQGTRLALQATAQILYAKIAWRMYEGGEIAVRDCYDLACAQVHAPRELRLALAHASPRVLATVTGIIAQLPQGWAGQDEKALIEPRHTWSEEELRRRALEALQGPGEQEQEFGRQRGR